MINAANVPAALLGHGSIQSRGIAALKKNLSGLPELVALHRVSLLMFS